MELKSYVIRLLTASDVDSFKNFRTNAIQEAPYAFVTTAEEFSDLTMAEVEGWLGPNENRFTLGAFSHNAQLVGTAGLRRESWKRISHNGIIWGVYVDPAHRRKQLGEQLVNRIIGQAQTLAGVSQLVLSVCEKQAAAGALYKKLGFKSYGKQPRALKFGREYLAEELLMLDLSSAD